MAPDGLTYVSSWVDDNFERWFQPMATDDLQLLDRRIDNWSDIIEFEIYPVSTSKGTADQINRPHLGRCRRLLPTARTTPVGGALNCDRPRSRHGWL